MASRVVLATNVGMSVHDVVSFNFTNKSLSAPVCQVLGLVRLGDYLVVSMPASLHHRCFNASSPLIIIDCMKYTIPGHRVITEQVTLSLLCTV